MKTYVVKAGNRGMVSIEPETFDIGLVDYHRSDIDWYYRIPEDGTLKTNGKEINVKKDDIVIQFYHHDYTKNDIVVIRNKEWKENLKARDKHEEMQRSKMMSDSCDKCNCCECESAN